MFKFACSEHWDQSCQFKSLQQRRRRYNHRETQKETFEKFPLQVLETQARCLLHVAQILLWPPSVRALTGQLSFKAVLLFCKRFLVHRSKDHQDKQYRTSFHVNQMIWSHLRFDETVQWRHSSQTAYFIVNNLSPGWTSSVPFYCQYSKSALTWKRKKEKYKLTGKQISAATAQLHNVN